MSHDIRHVWYDMDGVLGVVTPEGHAALDAARYHAYAAATGRLVTDELITEYGARYARYGGNAAVFRSLGLPPDYWKNTYAQLDPTILYKPDPAVTETVEALSPIVPESVFTNTNRDMTMRTLTTLALQPAVFTHILTGDEVSEQKPEPEGFAALIALSGVEPGQILYIGDKVATDIRPAHKLGIMTCLLYGQSDEADICLQNFRDIRTLF